jgi:3-oxoadipate enol-lactonase
MSPETDQAAPFRLDRDGDGPTLVGEVLGEGPPVVLLHGLTAARGYVVHGSRVLPRNGLHTIAYDARGHGESAPAGRFGGYSYDELAADLGTVLDRFAADRRCVLAGHSMGAHTLAAHALAHPDRVAAIVAIGPASIGGFADDRTLAYWDRLADGLDQDGVDGFIAAYDHDLDPDWRPTLVRLARRRLALHEHPEAVAQALREVPRSRPFDGLSELELLDLPALVVASHDEADPGHPYSVAQAWADHLPAATLTSEQPEESPLAWQGGRLSREIVTFCERPEVVSRLSE